MKKRDFNNKILQINCEKNGQQHSGSCFIIKANDKLFLVTASHVAKEINIEGYIFINDPITRHPYRINIKDLNPLNNWLFHPYSDVAIMTVNNLTISCKENDENEKSLSIEELAFEIDVDKYETNEEVNINDILFMYGCPEVLSNFPLIPFIVECKIVVETNVGAITLAQQIDLSKNYTVEMTDYPAKLAVAKGIFDTEQFANTYHYDGNDLGAVTVGEQTTFKVWAPTASKVVLNLFESGNDCDSYLQLDMTLGAKGVWSATAQDVYKKYYTYTVTTAVGTQEAVDPYAQSVGVNGMRGMVIDVSKVNVDGWENVNYLTDLTAYTQAVLWEVHVRDFSNQIAQSQHKGKYLAFTETGLTNASGNPVGVDYLKDLGVTHLHILPAFDYKSVDETTCQQFNWGYDPVNYNAPEGSYSSNPYDGEVRVKEFKQMVQGLHNQGLGVVMDMVYNHTADANSSFNKIVPYYYYRYNADGTNSSGSGCGNDTASERQMFRKFMVDSVMHWLTNYKLDGFRFDLMGLHDVQTMQQIEQAVHSVNPHAIIYGEAWTMTTATKATLATQENILSITATHGSAGAIACFNDATRDGLRGSVFDSSEAGYLGDPTVDRPKISFGIMGGEKANGTTWKVANGGVINYISAHDNHTLWDRLALTNPTSTLQQRLAMNRMGATIVMLSKGTPFMQAGEEILRTKPTDPDDTDSQCQDGFCGNSYRFSDACNNIKWETITQGSDQYQMLQYYKGLIALRKSNPLFTANNGVTIYVDLPVDARPITATFDGGNLGKAVMIVNPTSQPYDYDLPSGQWALVVDGTTAGTQTISTHSGTVTVAPTSAFVFIAK